MTSKLNFLRWLGFICLYVILPQWGIADVTIPSTLSKQDFSNQAEFRNQLSGQPSEELNALRELLLAMEKRLFSHSSDGAVFARTHEILQADCEMPESGVLQQELLFRVVS